MSIETIYSRLVHGGMSPVAACAMMGNMQAESAMISTNVQDGMGYSDVDYTAAVDAGQIDFAGDQRGYGLCQWTYAPRKRKLLSFARQRGVSIGDEEMQVDFCLKELQSDYAALWQYLKTATGVYEAAERICREYERPAVNNVAVRAQNANRFYMTLSSMDVSASPENVSTNAPSAPDEKYWPPRVLAYGMFGPDVVALQGLLIAHGFPAGISGSFDNATTAQLKAFQRYKALDADGIAGPLTWAGLVRR